MITFFKYLVSNLKVDNKGGPSLRALLFLAVQRQQWLVYAWHQHVIELFCWPLEEVVCFVSLGLLVLQ